MFCLMTSSVSEVDDHVVISADGPIKGKQVATVGPATDFHLQVADLVRCFKVRRHTARNRIRQARIRCERPVAIKSDWQIKRVRPEILTCRPQRMHFIHLKDFGQEKLHRTATHSAKKFRLNKKFSGSQYQLCRTRQSSVFDCHLVVLFLLCLAAD